MKKVLFLWVVFLSLFFNVAYAESQHCPPTAVRPSEEALTHAAKHAKDHGFLWKISKDGQFSYLYGTIHLAKFEGMLPGPETKKALLASDTIALELDMLGVGVQQQLMESIMRIKSHDIPDSLTERVKQAANAQCLPYEAIAAMMPEMQTMTLQLLAARADGLYTDYGIDMMLSGFGHAAKKEMISLETAEIQASVLRMETQQETIAFVEKGLSQLESGEVRKLTQRMYQTWLASDAKDLENYTEWCECVETESDKQFMEKILDKRNINMAENIDQLHHAGKAVFAAVGSLHMFGKKGLPNLMRKRGYRVERVVFQ